jgi:hypothetical protein
MTATETTSHEQTSDAERPDREVLIFGAVVAALGLGALAAPGFLARRFGTSWGDERSIILVLRAAAPAFLAMGVAAFATGSRWAAAHARAAAWLVPALAVAGYVALTRCLADWTIDDAAITFAYSKNLAAGHGLVIRAGHAPEEGYSNTLWMLMLAGARLLGADIALTAKRLCVAFGALAIALCFLVCQALLGKRLRFGLVALAMSVCLGAPFIVWTCSGLEHGLQAAMLALVVAAPLWPRAQRALMAVAFSALVLTRPEAPLLLAAVGAVLLLRDPERPTFAAALRHHWPVFFVPALTWALLVAFRISYFHDALSNPYYAKSQDASVLRLVNLGGRGWTYILGWLTDARTWLVVPILLLSPWRRTPLPYQLAVALAVAQLPFILYFGGDWMACYRFIAPVLPVLAVIVVVAVAEAGQRWERLSSSGVCLALAWLLGMGTIGQLTTFRTNPTTPTAVVAQIGRTFLELGARLGVDQPSLAHHDAGGTSYDANIELVDLGGLADRAVAKHMRDRAFMRKYIFEDRKPTFVFGTSHFFAAGETEFFRMPEFGQQYARLTFPGKPYMNAELCYVRRDVVHAAPGVREIKTGADETWEID